MRLRRKTQVHNIPNNNSNYNNNMGDHNDNTTSDESPLVIYGSSIDNSRSSIISSCTSFLPSIFLTVPEGYYGIISRQKYSFLRNNKRSSNNDNRRESNNNNEADGGNYSPCSSREDSNSSCSVFEPGRYMVHPSCRITHLVSKKPMILMTDIPQCLTNDFVRVNIKTIVTYRVQQQQKDNVKKFVFGNSGNNNSMTSHHGLTQQLRDSQAESMRVLVRGISYKQVYGLRSINSDAKKFYSILKKERKKNQKRKRRRIRKQQQQQKQTQEINRYYDDEDEDERESGVEEQKIGFSFSSSSTDDEDDEDVEDTDDENDLNDEDDESDSESFIINDDEQEINDLHQDQPKLQALEKLRKLQLNDTTTASSSQQPQNLVKDKLVKQFDPLGIEILDFYIHEVKLPSYLQTQMLQKAINISQYKEQRIQQKHDTLLLHQEQAIQEFHQNYEKEKLDLLENAKHEISMLKLELDHDATEDESTLEHTIAQMSIDVDLMAAKSDLAVQRIRDKLALETIRIDLNTQNESTNLYADTDATIRQIESDAELKCVEFGAKADKLLFEAEGWVAPKIKQFNEYQTTLKKIDVQDTFASAVHDKQGGLVLTGGRRSLGKKANRLVLMDAAFERAAEGGKTMEEKKKLLEELKELHKNQTNIQRRRRNNNNRKK